MLTDSETFQEFAMMLMDFCKKPASNFKQVNHLKECSEKESIYRIITMLNIIDRFINLNLRIPVFDTNKKLTEYLVSVVDVTFKACT